MAKQGMKRPEFAHRKNEIPPVPQIGGKARFGREKAPPLVAGGMGKVWHEGSFGGSDLAVDNLMDEMDLTAADRRDLER